MNPYFDPCWWRGHDYQFTHVTAEGRQCYACTRCGASYQTWTGTTTSTEPTR